MPHVFTGRAKGSRQGLLPVKYIPLKLNPAIFLVLLRPTSANKVLLPAPNGRNGMRFECPNLSHHKFKYKGLTLRNVTTNLYSDKCGFNNLLRYSFC